MKSTKKILFWLFGGIALAILTGLFLLPLWHLSQVSDNVNVRPHAQGIVNDVSRLNGTPVDSLVKVAQGYDSAVQQLSNLLVYAKANKIPVSIAGARHSMGGHTIAPKGIQISMLPFHHMNLDTSTFILTVGAGALWSEVIPYLNQYQRAVHVMQSDNAFSVGGSISVNCHGWQHNAPPIASTVLAFRLMNASGQVINCSRQENKELFSLVLGGYGLFGIILEVDVRTVPNESYSYHCVQLSSSHYVSIYSQLIDKGKNVRMVYGRLNVNKDHFLEKAVLNYFVYAGKPDSVFPAPSSSFLDLKRRIFLGSKENEYGKKLRWNAEWTSGRINIGNVYTRNQIMNESPDLYLNKDSNRTDILHEYFIPRKHVTEFIHQMQKILPVHSSCDLLNITIRNVYEDKDAFLRYATQEMFGFVLFFNQKTSPEADRQMKQLTQKLISAAIELEGTYYLPYRLHASQEQFLQGYPMAPAFFKEKLSFDPGELFQNKFYQEYKKKML